MAGLLRPMGGERTTRSSTRRARIRTALSRTGANTWSKWNEWSANASARSACSRSWNRRRVAGRRSRRRTTSSDRGTRASATCRHHRGLSLIRHIRAVGRWRRQHTRRPQPASWLVANAITNQRIEELYERAWEKSPQGAHEIYGTPQPVGRRHRLERIPHQRPPPHRHRMGPHPQTHILAYNPAFPILDIQIKKVKLGATEP